MEKLTMHFNIYKKRILLYILPFVCILVSIFFSSQAFAQVISIEPRFVTSVELLEAYPLFSPEDNLPGICIKAQFNASAPTAVVFQRAPASTIDNPEWTLFSVNNPLTTDSSLGIDYFIESSTGIQPGGEYIFQFLEVGEDGNYHIITPQNFTDDLVGMCAPNMQGVLNPSCQYGNVQVKSSCDSSTFAPGTSGAESNTVSPQIVTVGQNNNATVTLNTQQMPSGSNIVFIYTTNLSHITDAQFASASSVSVVTNDGPENIQLNSLQPNTTYYFSAITNSGQIVFLSSDNQLYSSFNTSTPGTSSGSSDSSSDSPNPATINVNINGEFGTTGIEQEIQAGFTQCGYGDIYDCDFNQLLATVDRIIKFMLYIIVLPIAAILFAWSGIKLIIARSEGKTKALGDAKAMFGRVLLGLVIAFGAWVLVKFVLVILGYTDASGLLSQILGITTTQ